MQLNKTALALASGLLWGFGVLFCTLWLVMRGGGEELELIGRFYIGYSVSVAGAFIGLGYGFVDGFIGGWLLGWMYNLFARRAS